VDWYLKFKSTSPSYGGVLLNTTFEECVMVRGVGSKQWGFPRGKAKYLSKGITCMYQCLCSPLVVFVMLCLVCVWIVGRAWVCLCFSLMFPRSRRRCLDRARWIGVGKGDACRVLSSRGVGGAWDRRLRPIRRAAVHRAHYRQTQVHAVHHPLHSQDYSIRPAASARD